MKANKNSNDLLVDATRAMREMVLAELFSPAETVQEDSAALRLLPAGMQHCVLCFHGLQEEKLQAEDSDAYETLLKEVLRYGDETVIARYAEVGTELPVPELRKIARQFFEARRWREAVLFYQQLPADAPEVDVDFWYGVGVCCMNLKIYETALECFEKAKTLGWKLKNIDTYISWCKEGLA